MPDDDIHDLLTDDGARWRQRLEPPPDLMAAAARALPRLAAPTRRRRRRPRRALVWGAAAVAALVVVGVHFLRDDTVRPFPGAAASVMSNGQRVPYVGPVSWTAPVTDAADPRLIYVFAKNDGAAGVCYVTVDRAVVVRQDSQRVSIEVAGYTPASQHGPACASLAHSPAHVAVRLAAPLAGRMLIDAHDGSAHRVLDATTVPDIHVLPPHCAATSLTWDPSTSIATRSSGFSTDHPCLIDMSYGASASMRQLDPPAGVAGRPVQIRGATASVTTFDDHLNNDAIAIEWSPRAGYVIRLQINVAPKHPISLAEAIATARSIH